MLESGEEKQQTHAGGCKVSYKWIAYCVCYVTSDKSTDSIINQHRQLTGKHRVYVGSLQCKVRKIIFKLLFQI